MADWNKTQAMANAATPSFFIPHWYLWLHLAVLFPGCLAASL
jgi:hypothetical protein